MERSTKFIVAICIVIIIGIFVMRFAVIKPEPIPEQHIPYIPDPIQTEQVASKDYVRFIFFDVGQGDSILVKTTNQTMLVDCGPGKSEEKLISDINSFTDHIDYLVVTHTDEDHIGGCDEVVKKYQPNHILIDGQTRDTKAYGNFVNASSGTSLQIVKKYDEIGMSGVRVKVIHANVGAKDPNQNAIVLRFDYKEVSALLTADCDGKCEQELLKENIDVDILKVPHHGSKYGTSEEFLKKVTPKWAVISVGNNSYGHPDQGVIDRLMKYGTEIGRTDGQMGAVIIRTNGELPPEPVRGEQIASV